MTRDELLNKFTEAGISAGVYYPETLSNLEPIKPYAKNLSNPVAEKIAKEVISIPVYPGLSQEDLERIVNVLL
jgi:dTDP-4-amino-4,6-dideoxygalactose transaminase